MKLHHLLLLATIGAQATNVEVEGEISLKLDGPENLGPYQNSVKDSESVRDRIYKEPSLLDDDHVVRVHESEMTVAPVVECRYQIPEESQVQALLSNMMNELTKMFVRAHEMMNGNYRRKGATRFRVVNQKQTAFFEDIYSNMTQQYLTFYNSTAVRVYRSDRTKDPCANQEEMKELWKELLDSSLTTFRQAAFKCIDEHLKAREEGTDPSVRDRMSQYLLRELGKIKMRQLTLLCDKFQLCFDELISRKVM